SPGVHRININGLRAFDVLCDSETVGPGWTVISQRIKGNVDFNRNWRNYTKGFGSFDGDFFLGLENIYQLTKWSNHELVVVIEKFDGTIENERYTRFQIGCESMQYRVKHFWANDNVKFSTFDRDNDAWSDGNCAEKYHGGWWYDDCGQR
ncbi:hypothetical protein KR044_001752, partial [Drosophila immigrans]